jgi:hypothetical protein
MSMFGTALNPRTLITKQWIAKEYVETDLFFIGRRDDDFVGGYKPHIMEMKALVDIIASAIAFTDLTDTPDALGTPGQILQVDPTAEFLEFVDPIDDFLDLLDTPTDYTSFAGYFVVVNQTEDGLEFQAPVLEEVRYEARVDFNTTNNPSVSQQLEDALGVTVTLSREAVGVYRANLSAVVDQTKLIAWLSPTAQGVFIPTVYSTTYVEFEHHAFTGGLADATLNDVSVEIKLYP